MPRKSLDDEMTSLRVQFNTEIDDLRNDVERIVRDLNSVGLDMEGAVDNLYGSVQDAFDAFDNLTNADDEPEPAIAALIETLQGWRPILNAAIASAPLNDAVQNLRGISAAIVDITHDYPAR